MALVKATQRGFDGREIRDPGEVFEWNGPLASWMEPSDRLLTQAEAATEVALIAEDTEAADPAPVPSQPAPAPEPAASPEPRPVRTYTRRK